MGWNTLEERLKTQRLPTMYKITHELTQRYMRDPLSIPYNKTGYQLHNSTAIPAIITRTSLFQKYLFPQTTKDRNNLDTSLKDSPYVSNFKRNLIKKIPNINHRIGSVVANSIFHAHFQMLCSALMTVYFLISMLSPAPNAHVGTPRSN